MQKGIGKKGISDSENKRKYVLFSASKIAKNRHAISEVVTTVLMVLLALGAILLVWFLVKNLISNAGEQIDLSKLTLSFTIPGNSVYVDQPLKSVSFVVQRQAGAGAVSGLKVIVTDTGGQSVTQNVVVALGELESKAVSVSYASSSLGQIAKVSVAPIVKSASGNEQTGSVAAEYFINDANVHNMVLNFNTGSSYVNITKTVATAQSFSVGFFEKSSPSSYGYFAQARGNGWNDGFHLWGNPAAAGAIYMRTGNGAAGIDNAPAGGASIGSWGDGNYHYITLVINRDTGNTMKIYLDGVEKGSTDISTISGMTTLSAVKIGLSLDGTLSAFHFNGIISDFRIYTKALSSDEIKQIYTGDNLGTVAKSNLAGWWKLDEGQGTTAIDSSGNGNDGIIGGGASWISG